MRITTSCSVNPAENFHTIDPIAPDCEVSPRAGESIPRERFGERPMNENVFSKYVRDGYTVRVEAGIDSADSAVYLRKGDEEIDISQQVQKLVLTVEAGRPTTCAVTLISSAVAGIHSGAVKLDESVPGDAGGPL